MWYAVTAQPVSLKDKEKKKEFFRAEIEVILNAETRQELEKKLSETRKKFPSEMNKYLRAGIKILQADNLIQAKRKSSKVHIYFDERGQYHFL
jgi:hypothetical protein